MSYEINREHEVADGETLESLATAEGLTVSDLAVVNFGTTLLHEINRALYEVVGARELTADKATYVFSDKDKKRGTGKILIPKKFEAKDLPPGTTKVVVLKPKIPMVAVGLEALDKWFAPGPSGDTCVVKYLLEGNNNHADKVTFEVYGSNYAEASLDGSGKPTYTALEGVPVYALEQPEARTSISVEHEVSNWKGESTAASGVLKPRAGKTRYINVSFSPYTALLRFYKAEADKEARITIRDFWPQFRKSGKVRKKSLEITWKIENCDRLKHGQVRIYDRTDTLVFCDALQEDQLTPGEHTYEWNGELFGDQKIDAAEMPYRVQIQAHTGVGEVNGVALAAMHTEVRLFVDSSTDTIEKTPWQEQNTLQWFLAPQAPVVPTEAGDEDRWYQYQLAEAGFHPGPVDGNLARADCARALREAQRALPRQIGPGNFARLPVTGTKNADTAQVLRTLAADTLPWFGEPSHRTDYNRNDALTRLKSSSSADGIIAWVGDRQYYTQAHPGNAFLPAGMFLDNYRGGMSIGDGKATADAAHICRPWIPLGIDLPILKRDTTSQGLQATNSQCDDSSRQAIGCLPIHWSFEEIGEQDSVIDMLHPAYSRDFVRSHRFVEWTVKKQKKKTKGKVLTNCPTDLGGVRHNDLDDYVKEVFGHGNECLTPWQVNLDEHRGVYTVTYDDWDQPDAEFYESHLGRSGAYLHLSHIGGDGYRFCARLDFEESDHALTKHPNREVLARRYEKRPRAYTCGIRMWRKTSYRGYTGWCPPAEKNWPGHRAGCNAFYSQCFVHIADEDTVANLEEPVGNLITQAEYANIITSTVIAGAFSPIAATLSTHFVWPYASSPRLGFRPSDPGQTFQQYHKGVNDMAKELVWNRYRRPLMWFLVSKF